jgi:hypothetical protein
MDVASSLVELYDRVPPLVRGALEGVDLDHLTQPPAPRTNTMAWLVWHLTRVQDHHISELLAADQVWVGGVWAADFGLDPDPTDTGYGHTWEQVLAVRPARAEVLLEYLDAVYRRTRLMLQGLVADDLDRVVDRRWDPPVTLGVRLVSVADDMLQHVGQAAYARGILTG